MLENICLGNDITIGSDEINDSNRRIFYNVFLEIYEKLYKAYKASQKQGIEKAKKAGKYAGRKPIIVDTIKFIDLEEKVKNKEITRQELMKQLGISKDKYYRLREKVAKQY